MKPMGTITKYYPFIADETKSILETLMKESSNYFEFIRVLTQHILENESSEDLVYIAATQCWYAEMLTEKNAILEKYNALALIKPWAFVWGTQERWNFEICEALLQSIDLAVKPPTDKWKTVEILLGHGYNLSERPEAENLLSTAKTLMNQDPDLLCFEPLVYLIEGNMKYLEGKISDAITLFRKSRELALAKRDPVYEFFSLLFLGYTNKNKNPQESIDLVEQAYQIAQILGVPIFRGESLHYIGGVYETLGEYDLAISSHLESLKEYPPTRNEMIFAILSRIYAAIGNGQASLEWADRALEDNAFHIGYLRKARALIVLGRLDEAEMFLDTARERVLQIGDDTHLARYYFVSGLFDMARGEFANAIGTLEQAYDILYPHEILIYLNEILIALTKAEFALHRQSLGSGQVMPEKWILKLENHAHIYDLSGIAMQAALLRSEIFESQGHLQDAHETLQRALGLSESPGVKTLRGKINARLKKIDRLMQGGHIQS